MVTDVYSDPNHISSVDDPLEDCIEKALLNGGSLYDCKEIELKIDEEDVTIWGGVGETGRNYCAEIVIIDADNWFSKYPKPIAIINSIREYIRSCSKVEKIIIVGDQKAMSGFKVVNNKCKKHGQFSAFISGINVLKGIRKNPPLHVCCLTSWGKRQTLEVIKTHYK